MKIDRAQVLRFILVVPFVPPLVACADRLDQTVPAPSRNSSAPIAPMTELIGNLHRAPSLALFGPNLLAGEVGQVISIPRTGETPTVAIKDENLRNSEASLDIDKLFISGSALLIGASGRSGHYRVVRFDFETGKSTIVGHVENGTLVAIVLDTVICTQYNSRLCLFPAIGGQRRTAKWNVQIGAALSDEENAYLIDKTGKLLKYTPATQSIEVLLSDLAPDASLAQDATNVFVATGAVVKRLGKTSNFSATVIYSGKAPRVLSAAGETVFVQDGGVIAISNVGGAPRLLAPIEAVNAVADGRYVYASALKKDGSGVVYKIQYTL